jgi:hypothetical protein
MPTIGPTPSWARQPRAGRRRSAASIRAGRRHRTCDRAHTPILLYIESPYGLLEVIDWMAQAQLLVELGPERFLQARAAGVRDMVAFLERGGSEEGRRLLAPLLVPEGQAGDEALQVSFASIAHKLHVQHLHHWWMVISQALDGPAKAAPITRLEAAE